MPSITIGAAAVIAAMLLDSSVYDSTVKGSAPIPIRPEQWLGPSDYPDAEVTAGHAGKVTFELQVDATGRPVACSVLETSGSSALDRRACLVMLTRSRFRPARVEGGAKAAGVFVHSIAWVLNDASRRFHDDADWTDAEIVVSRLPAGRLTKAVVRQAVRADGSVESCVAGDTMAPASLVSIACRQVAAAARPVRIGGRAVLTVRDWRVSFVTTPTPGRAARGGPTFVRSDLSGR